MGLLSCKRKGSLSSTWIRLATFALIISAALQAVSCESEPTESQCRPYIEKALKQQHGDAEESTDDDSLITNEQEENVPTDELAKTIEESVQELLEDLGSVESEKAEEHDDGSETNEDETEEPGLEDDAGREDDNDENYKQEQEEQIDQTDQDTEGEGESVGGEAKEEESDEPEEAKEIDEEQESDQEGKEVEEEEQESDQEGKEEEKETEVERDQEGKEVEEEQESDQEGKEEEQETEVESDQEEKEIDEKEYEQDKKAMEAEEDAIEEKETEEVDEQDEPIKTEDDRGDEEQEGDEQDVEAPDTAESEEKENEEVDSDISQGAEAQVEGQYSVEEGIEKDTQEGVESQVETPGEGEGEHEEAEESLEGDGTLESEDAVHEEKEEESLSAAEEDANEAEGEEPDLTPEEDLTKEVIIPENLRPRDHITKILRLDEDSIETESALQKTIDSTLKSLKGLYDSAIKPLEMLYKYRDLSNRHFGDPEIFSKPLILFMGPWSGGKSSTINYLLDNEFTEMSLRTGAEPSPAYFNILMYGAEEEVLDGTQLAADWTFSGLQKFGQSLLDRLKGYKLPNRLLEKVNIVEIPGILEIRKQVQRLFPFNDACQWFIDRADIIFLVYDPSKLDVGPETEAILDQLKGREYQTRIILNKADQVKPEEIMRVQGTLIWNISPLMSSSEPPIMYTTSLWSMPYETGAPTRLLLAQERAFLRDMREAIDKRVENKIASARRFAVRVRNHAKMVDCYLTTYYNHKTFFGNRKKISDDIIENPQKYHIYEGLSTLTNISRYDLPDPDVYRDFFKLNPLYDFTKLSDTCTYFRGCPINTLDVTIAYDLPELVGKYKKSVEASKAQSSQKTNS